jgi:hypothetical protein
MTPDDLIKEAKLALTTYGHARNSAPTPRANPAQAPPWLNAQFVADVDRILGSCPHCKQSLDPTHTTD